MDLLMWLVVGLIAGVLASLVVGGSGYGLIGDVVVGMVGALIGGWLFDALAVSTPLEGVAGSIFVAFVGAVLLLIVLHLVRRRTYGRRTYAHHGPVARRPLWSRWRR